MKFYICKNNGNIVTFLQNVPAAGIDGSMDLTELIPGSVDAATEKHVPDVTRSGNTLTVNVGSVAHPMLPAHFIQWIAVETNQGSQIKYLKPETAPEAVFALADGEEAIAVYEYCNLHGLWKTEL